MTQPLVSVLIPVYNRHDLVSEAIVSALNQTYQNIEIIISDNCSTDGTWEMLTAKYAATNNIKLIRTTENIGPVPNWKHCLDHANGEYVKFLFSDDWMHCNCIDEMVRALRVSRCDIVISSVLESYNGVKSEACKLQDGILTMRQVISLLIAYKIPLSPGAALYRKKAVIIEYNFNDQRLSALAAKGIGPDLLMFISASRNGCMLKRDFLNIFRRHRGSISVEHSGDLHFFYRLFLYKYGSATLTQLILIKLKNYKYFVRKYIKSFLVKSRLK